MNIIVRTRSQSKLLYERMRRFIPEEITAIAHTGYSSWSDASSFLHDAIEISDDMLLVLDEDAYIINWEAVHSLIGYIKQNGYTHSGIPDGGLIEHRKHSFVTVNPFFVVFNCGLIKNLKKDVTRKDIDSSVFEPEMELFKPDWIKKEYNHDKEEPFAGLFYWLIKVGKPLFLMGRTLKDKISTEVIGQDGNTLCLHSWYSRSYHWDQEHQLRIDRIYRSAIRKRSVTV